MASARKLAAPRKPTLANTRRLRARPTRLANGAEIVPQNSEPRPPQKSGRIASRAASCCDSFQYCCRYVGSQVMPKYQGNERRRPARNRTRKRAVDQAADLALGPAA